MYRINPFTGHLKNTGFFPCLGKTPRFFCFGPNGKCYVANEVSDNSGAGGEKISVSGVLHAVGDPVQGKFDTVTKQFTAGDFSGKYDA